MKEGLYEAGSWLAAEGRVIVRNWVATAARYLWLDVGGGDKAHWMRCRQSWCLTVGPSIRPPHMEPKGLMRTGEPLAVAA